MVRFCIEETLVIALGFCIGAALATCVAPGNVPLWVGAGVLAAIVLLIATSRV